MNISLQSSALMELLRTRRSVRRFTPEPVPRETIERLLEAATCAPNAHNRQLWRFVVLESGESRERLAEAMGAEFRKTLESEGIASEEIEAQVKRSRARLIEAPAAIVLCMDSSAIDIYADPNRQHGEVLMAVQSIALAGGNLLLAAHAEGLGAAWLCAPLFAPEAVCRALELPQSWEAQALILVGHPAGVPKPRPRLPISELIKFS